MDGKYMVNEKYSFKLSNYARDLISSKVYFFHISSYSPDSKIINCLVYYDMIYYAEYMRSINKKRICCDS